MAIDPPALAAQGGERRRGHEDNRAEREQATRGSSPFTSSAPFLKEVSEHPHLGW